MGLAQDIRLIRDIVEWRKVNEPGASYRSALKCLRKLERQQRAKKARR